MKDHTAIILIPFDDKNKGHYMSIHLLHHHNEVIYNLELWTQSHLVAYFF